jgi:hypothetical protein
MQSEGTFDLISDTTAHNGPGRIQCAVFVYVLDCLLKSIFRVILYRRRLGCHTSTGALSAS